MGDYFLHHEPVGAKKLMHDLYHRPNPIHAARTSRSWAITGIKRKKGMLNWTHSLAGRRFYRKLALHKALHEHFEIIIARKTIVNESEDGK